jgi:hypothetical protein
MGMNRLQIKELNKYCKKTTSGKHMFICVKIPGESSGISATGKRCLACGIFKDEEE